MQYTKDDYDAWNERKYQIHSTAHHKFVKVRRVCLVESGLNAGTEQNGNIDRDNDSFLRFYIILKVFNEKGFWGVPMTTATLTESSNVHLVNYVVNENRLMENVVVLLKQLKYIDTKRVVEGRTNVGTISLEDFAMIVKKIKNIFPT